MLQADTTARVRLTLLVRMGDFSDLQSQEIIIILNNDNDLTKVLNNDNDLTKVLNNDNDLNHSL